MFGAARYEVRQVFLPGNRYTVYEDSREEPILAGAREVVQSNADFRFTDPGTGEERFRVTADGALDPEPTYEVIDTQTDERIGAVSRTVTSIGRHEYTLHDATGNAVATLKEASALNATVRRFLTTLLPFSYTIESPDGRATGCVKEAFSLRDSYTVDLVGAGTGLDPRLAVIATVVIDAIEGTD